MRRGREQPWADADEDEPETWLTFIHRVRVLDPVGVNTAAHHGARAYIDGRYVRVGPMTEKGVKQVEQCAAGIDIK